MIRLSGEDFATQETLEVGDGPVGVGIAEAQGIAFVANSEDHTLTAIDLDEFTVVATFDTSDGIGLTPTDVSVDDDPLVTIIANQLSLSVTLFGFVE